MYDAYSWQPGETNFAQRSASRATPFRAPIPTNRQQRTYQPVKPTHRHARKGDRSQSMQSSLQQRQAAEERKQKKLAFGAAVLFCLSSIGLFGWMQTQVPASNTKQLDPAFQTELDTRMDWLNGLVQWDFKPQVKAPGYRQKLALNEAATERRAAKQAITQKGNKCNHTSASIETCLAMKLGEEVYIETMRVLGGERFALVSLDDKGKIKKVERELTKEQLLDNNMFRQIAFDGAVYDAQYDFPADPVESQILAGKVAEARIERLSKENRTDIAAELQRLRQWQAGNSSKPK